MYKEEEEEKEKDEGRKWWSWCAEGKQLKWKNKHWPEVDALFSLICTENEKNIYKRITNEHEKNEPKMKKRRNMSKDNNGEERLNWKTQF